MTGPVGDGVGDRAPKLSAAEFVRLVGENMGLRDDFQWSIVEFARGHVKVRLEYVSAFVRPGGTISGPTMFTLADLTLYAAVLSEVGLVPLAVTTDMTIHFLRRPEPIALVAEAKLMRSGSKLVCGDIWMWSEGLAEPVAHAVGTYAVPPRRP